MTKAGYRVGIDIGGTFTDGLLISEVTGEVWIAKTLSTPSDPSLGFITALGRLLDASGVETDALQHLFHATTVATNAIIEGKLGRTGLITTEGFRDILEIARQIRPTLYDLRFEKPRPLVPRHLCFGVRERLAAGGEVLVPLDEESVRAAVAELRREGVVSIAVCLLHSYANAAHERRIGKIATEMFPEATLSLSAEVAPEFREYLRASTTAINAAVRPVVDRYLGRIEEELSRQGISADLHVMQSNGGMYTAEAARIRPVLMVESGPAAGVMAASFLGQLSGYQDVISFDMGGTTAKVGMVKGGEPEITKEFEVGGTAASGVGSRRGSGYPMRTPVIDLVEIGAGGGSIAWIDSGGALRVGPRSAGADPGPVCYGRGGTEPTVTDANLVLGYLNPDYFLGGELTLDANAARAAIQEVCAFPLGLSIERAAVGIVEIANAAMVNALHLISVQRGEDPRDFALIAFGGAGPAHANRLAAEVGIGTTLIPRSPGIASALGLLATDFRREYSATVLAPVDRADSRLVSDTFRSLEEHATRELERDGVAAADRLIRRSAEMRYVGQSYELAVAMPADDVDEATLKGAVDRFHAEHERLYGYQEPTEPVELVTLRVAAVGRIPKPILRRPDESAGAVEHAVKGSRNVYFDQNGGYVECPVYERSHLSVGSVLAGPAIVEEFDATTVIHPHYWASVDGIGTLVLSETKQ